MSNQTRTVVSKSAKRKMSNGENVKAGTYTEQVIYKTKLPNGKFASQTKHEISYPNK